MCLLETQEVGRIVLVAVKCTAPLVSILLVRRELLSVLLSDLGMVKDEELADLESLFLEDVEPVEACAHFTDVLRSLNLSL